MVLVHAVQFLVPLFVSHQLLVQFLCLHGRHRDVGALKQALAEKDTAAMVCGDVIV